MATQIHFGNWWSTSYPRLFAHGTFSVPVPVQLAELTDDINDYSAIATICYNGLYRYGSKMELPCTVTSKNGNVTMVVPYENGKLNYNINIPERKGTYNLDNPRDCGEISLTNENSSCVIS